jgi:hypothetical protein
LGSAVSIKAKNDELPPHLSKDFSGSWEYAPPELLYGEVNNDSIIRRIGCDLYLLGSMIAFYFTNMSMTALIAANLTDGLSWKNPSNYGKYDIVKSYVKNAFEQALTDIGRNIESKYLRDNLILMIRYLCNPDPKKRGHKKNIAEIGSDYALERFISTFDLLARKTKLNQI